jgi:hypothetical protein
MTKQEAESEGFGEILIQTITARLRLMHIPYGQKYPWALVKIREALWPILGPWFTVELKDAGKDIPLVILWEVGETFPRYHTSLDVPDPRGIETLSPLRAQLDMLLAYKITSFVERIRADILSGKPLSSHQLKVAKVYHNYLESGDPSDMPMVMSGQQQKREMLFPGHEEPFVAESFRRHPHLQNGSCQYCQARTEEENDSKFRTSMERAAVSARKKIQAYFRELERTPGGLSDNQDIFSPSYSESDIRAINSTFQRLTFPISGRWAFTDDSYWAVGTRAMGIGIGMFGG